MALNELNPCKLRELSDESRQVIVNWIGENYDNMVKTARNYADEDGRISEEDWVQQEYETLMVGLDTLLEALGRPGHEFT